MLRLGIAHTVPEERRISSFNQLAIGYMQEVSRVYRDVEGRLHRETRWERIMIYSARSLRNPRMLVKLLGTFCRYPETDFYSSIPRALSSMLLIEIVVCF